MVKPSVRSVLEPYFSKVRGAVKPGAFRLQKLLTPQLSLGILNIPSILVGGSNGKGSTCSYLEKILRDSDFKTGLYTSPHLIHPNERIRISGIPISEEILAKYVLRMEEQSKSYLPDASFFEITTGIALLIFLEMKIDVLICEVGLGGRYDSTNAISPLVSVLTSVSLEHTELLGNTLEEIGADKAYISRRNKPFVISNINDKSLNGAIQTSKLIGSEVHEAQLCDAYDSNLNLAVTAAQLFFEIYHIKKDISEILLSAKNTFWPGRFDIRNKNSRDIIFDAAHNPSGFSYFIDKYTKSKYSNQKCVLLFACLADKDWKSMFKLFPSFISHVIFTSVNSNRSEKIENFKSYIDELTQNHYNFPSYETIEEEKAAVNYGLSVAEHLPFVVIGSIAFIGNVMEHLEIEVFPS